MTSDHEITVEGLRIAHDWGRTQHMPPDSLLVVITLAEGLADEYQVPPEASFELAFPEPVLLSSFRIIRRLRPEAEAKLREQDAAREGKDSNGG